MDIEDPKEEKVNITQKLETIDYSHGVLGTNRGWADEDQHAVQSVDYNHGQGAGQGFGPGSYASQAAYGGFPGYPGYEGFPQHPGGSFPGGMDAAALFAAYSEQTSEFQSAIIPITVLCIVMCAVRSVVNFACH